MCGSFLRFIPLALALCTFWLADLPLSSARKLNDDEKKHVLQSFYNYRYQKGERKKLWELASSELIRMGGACGPNLRELQMGALELDGVLNFYWKLWKHSNDWNAQCITQCYRCPSFVTQQFSLTTQQSNTLDLLAGRPIQNYCICNTSKSCESDRDCLPENILNTNFCDSECIDVHQLVNDTIIGMLDNEEVMTDKKIESYEVLFADIFVAQILLPFLGLVLSGVVIFLCCRTQKDNTAEHGHLPRKAPEPVQHDQLQPDPQLQSAQLLGRTMSAFDNLKQQAEQAGIASEYLQLLSPNFHLNEEDYKSFSQSIQTGYPGWSARRREATAEEKRIFCGSDQGRRYFVDVIYNPGPSGISRHGEVDQQASASNQGQVVRGLRARALSPGGRRR